jgi:hypothetical protein
MGGKSQVQVKQTPVPLRSFIQIILSLFHWLELTSMSISTLEQYVNIPKHITKSILDTLGSYKGSVTTGYGTT